MGLKVAVWIRDIMDKLGPHSWQQERDEGVAGRVGRRWGEKEECSNLVFSPS